jgi:adenine-specific DNA methylase
MDRQRLIEVAFPLKQASLDSVHEKNVRHGHISTLHIWPARRPLAACRAALIATLLPDPGNAEERRQILERLGGKVVEATKRKKMPNGKIEEVVSEETVGGILHWGRESGPDLDWFRAKIREAYGGRAPKVLDPFAGGGAIPLEAMRLGCEATAIDINPVAWFILKCTLEYPQKLAGQKRPLPSFVLENREFMEGFFKAQGLKGATLRTQLEKLGLGDSTSAGVERELPGMMGASVPLDADLAWHVRAWGRWVLDRARADLERFYPTIDGKPTVAYLWARTVKCKHCRATLPLLKTRWLCKKDNKRIVLTIEPNADKTGGIFGVQSDVPVVGSNAAQRREHDKRIGSGTMSRSGATCPCCDGIMTMEDLRLEGLAGRIGAVMTAVVVDCEKEKGYRQPTEDEHYAVIAVDAALNQYLKRIPYGLPHEPTPRSAGTRRNSSSLRLYGMNEWCNLFSARQLLALATFVATTRIARAELARHGYPIEWIEAIGSYLTIATDRLEDYSSALCTWHNTGEKMRNTFGRFALPMVWDFAEVEPCSRSSGGYLGAVEWIADFISHATTATSKAPEPTIYQRSATEADIVSVDVIVTDPPYYDAIIYSDIMDFFYVWLRRTLDGVSPSIDATFKAELAPKWDHTKNDGELVDDPGRFDWDLARSRYAYENGMLRAFQACYRSLALDGRMVVVFANKQSDAWESLVSAIVRAGFVVDGSWPIQTEMSNRTRALTSSALSSSVWLVCKKRPESARPGWDSRILQEMHERIVTRLREFWDAGIRGPDFVWAATGPALEAYSKHPIVKKADEPGQVMSVSEFLGNVRRIVVNFVVGRVLTGDSDAEAVTGLDDVTTYYLLHRHDFGMEDTPAGACILYAISCGLSDGALADQYDMLVRTGGQETDNDDESEDGNGEVEDGSGSKVKLKPWHQRRRPRMGFEAAGGRPVPLIDQVHRLMQLWKAGELSAVDDYLDGRGLRRSALFHQLLQALIELADAGSDERSLLESVSNYVGAKSPTIARLPGI